MRLGHEAQLLFVAPRGVDDLFQLDAIFAGPDVDTPKTYSVVVGTSVGAATN